MDLLVGTSGFSYVEWKGSFYPEGLKDAEMLTSYSERLSTVEINNTFYRIPRRRCSRAGTQGAEARQFAFALKAPKSITHISRLKDAADGTAYFLKVASTLGEHLGPILFQLPPFFKKDAGVLREFWRRFRQAFRPRSSSDIRAGSTTKPRRCSPTKVRRSSRAIPMR